MRSIRKTLWTTTVIPLGLGVGALALGVSGLVPAGERIGTLGAAEASGDNPCAAENPCAADNPCAAACDPCAPDACDPCAPAACDPCAPAGCGPCDPCGPCAAAAGVGTECYIPRIQEAAAENPCAVCDPCAPACDPCAPACDPCAADNPCAAENQCAAACDPCAAACDPCAPANPCAVEDPCAPCAACDPCAACGPCAAACAPEVTDEEARAAYDCIIENLRGAQLDTSWADSDLDGAMDFLDWENVANAPYPSATHGNRLATNHANPLALSQYEMYEEIEAVPAGGIIAKPTFTVNPHGEAELGPLFLMEKAEAGAFPDSNDWIYSTVNPDGSLMGRTGGMNSDMMQSCAGCHMAMGGEWDDLIFLPDEYRR